MIRINQPFTILQEKVSEHDEKSIFYAGRKFLLSIEEEKRSRIVGVR